MTMRPQITEKEAILGNVSIVMGTTVEKHDLNCIPRDRPDSVRLKNDL